MTWAEIKVELGDEGDAPAASSASARPDRWFRTGTETRRIRTKWDDDNREPDEYQVVTPEHETDGMIADCFAGNDVCVCPACYAQGHHRVCCECRRATENHNDYFRPCSHCSRIVCEDCLGMKVHRCEGRAAAAAAWTAAKARMGWTKGAPLRWSPPPM